MNFPYKGLRSMAKLWVNIDEVKKLSISYINIPKDVLNKWDDFLNTINEEDIYESGFNEGYIVAIDEGSSKAYNDGFRAGYEDGYEEPSYLYGWS